MAIILFIAVLALIVLGHEFGHFLAAKISGVKVSEFGAGFPPKIWGKKAGETEYSVNWLPFGGFVRILGFGDTCSKEFDALPEEEKARSLSRKSRLTQLFVILGGVLANFAIAWVILSIGLMIGLPMSRDYLGKNYDVKESRLVITGVLPNSPAKATGLRAGDKIVFLTTSKSAIQEDELSPESFRDFIAKSAGEKVFVGVEGGKTFSAIPALDKESGDYKIGISMEQVGILKFGFFRSFYEGAKLTVVLTMEMIAGLANFVVGFFDGDSTIKSISGPVGIVGVVGSAWEIGFIYLLNIVALISINFAVLNLLPFPALDGGWIVVVLLEAIKGKSLQEKTVGRIMGGGFFLLLLLMIIVTYNDIVAILTSF